ncbi:MAG: hypothetical protein ACI8PZ_005628, partial [Myxococcota bacterium]
MRDLLIAPGLHPTPPGMFRRRRSFLHWLRRIVTM